VYEALLVLKRGNMTFSDLIGHMLNDGYGWPEMYPVNQRDLADFIEFNAGS
jgi:hypothetical protein